MSIKSAEIIFTVGKVITMLKKMPVKVKYYNTNFISLEELINKNRNQRIYSKINNLYQEKN